MRQRRIPDERRTCPRCSQTRSSATTRAEKVMSVWVNADGSDTYHCHHCNASGLNRQSRYPSPVRRRASARPDYARFAASLWRLALPAESTAVEDYNRQTRRIDLLLPATIGYLPARNGHPHAQIAAFGFSHEVEPGVLAAPDSVEAVHITRLTPDGRDKMEKRMLGPVSGKPIVLAPPNDALGLVITEGIEDALSIHAVTGLGAWAAGSASHMAKLAPAVPEYIECVTVVADPDPAGQKGAVALSEQLRLRGFDVIKKTLKRHGG